ncbi:MAG TPA: squalene/phytoene synthase family protein [Solirubrobacteraceae bacterium]|nr:squalene/phytoene synthase family protein [Solirubrobacteraceae bacterium]
MSGAKERTPGMAAPASLPRLAYRQCEAITRGQVSNFYHGIRLLPGEQRAALCAIYAYARRVDDIGDGVLDGDEKLRRLDALQAALHELSPHDPDPVLAAVADAAARFALPLDAFDDLIEGVRMDVRGTSYARFAELELYCRRVAGSIGRLCVAVYGRRSPPPPPARPPQPVAGEGTRVQGDPDAAARPPRSVAQMADDLGVAMQIVNIVRDLREDAQRGRVYLPTYDLVRYHLHDDGPLDAAALAALAREGSHAEPPVIAGFDGGDVGQLYALMRFQCLRARNWFHEGLELLPLLDRRSAASVRAMAGIYLRLLHHIEERPDMVLAGRISLKSREKAWVVGRALVGKGVPERHPAERLTEEDER